MQYAFTFLCFLLFNFYFLRAIFVCRTKTLRDSTPYTQEETDFKPEKPHFDDDTFLPEDLGESKEQG